jgi:hypothetical protein
MKIKDFCISARKANWKLYIMHDSNGYCVFQQFVSDDPEFISTQRGQVRYWKSLDVLIKHVTENGFSGDVQLEISRQSTL